MVTPTGAERQEVGALPSGSFWAVCCLPAFGWPPRSSCRSRELYRRAHAVADDLAGMGAIGGDDDKRVSVGLSEFERNLDGLVELYGLADLVRDYGVCRLIEPLWQRAGHCL
jgi:hypothetical protein